ncbi:MAG: DNA polymerase II large subunit [Candidatus Woesearchaeota archaeon]
MIDKPSTPQMQEYFQQLTDSVNVSYEIAKRARKKGLDPEEEVPIPLAKNMAERVVGLISVVAPQVMGSKIPERILELEKQYGILDWRVGFKIAEEVAKEVHCKFETKQEAMEVGIRMGFAYLTLGIVSCPLEGFIGLKIKKRMDGKEYFALQYAGPIRAAGGTAAAASVILSDYVRIKMGYAKYDPQESEINRYATEIQDYHERVTNLQYFPSEEELKFMVSRLPVEVDGDPTEIFEVSNYKDLPRVETNMIRGGVCLVLAEGLTQKAPKLWKKLSKWGKEFDLDWEFLADFIKLKEKIHSGHGAKEEDKNAAPRVKPNDTFIMDLVAGRPILTHPMAEGGFRLRYGRGRTCGMYAMGFNPSTLIVLDKYIAVGTQLKVERPRKGASVTLCDTVDGPIVRIKDGTVLKLSNEEEAKRINPEIEEILFLGDMLFNYGDFSESGHTLVPAGYCPEWWVQELEKSLNLLYETNQEEKRIIIAKNLGWDVERLKEILNNYLTSFPTLEEARFLSKTFNVSLHPEYTFYWKLISGKEVFELLTYLKEGKIKFDEKGIFKMILPYFQKDNPCHEKGKKVLDKLGVPHLIVNKENLILERNEINVFCLLFDFKNPEELERYNFNPEFENKNGLEIINSISPVSIRDKAGTFIGARMGRPEKAKMRLMTGSPQVMFPVGEEGDRLRSFQSAIENGKVTGDFPLFFCLHCNRKMIYPSCEECGQKCVKKYYCKVCGDLDKDTCRHGKNHSYKKQEIDIKYYFDKAKKRVGDAVFPEMIKGVRGTSNKEHYVEHLIKGVLRAKHDIYVNKDGTTRYDCTELPLTHFKSKEIKASVSKLISLGYTVDIYGNPLENEDQILELKPQDVVLPGYDSLDESGARVLSRVANFVDELLIKFYGLEPFYNIKKEEDLIGHLIVGLAPHISAGIVGRIIGFSESQGFMAHPMYHAAMRRDCDGDEACLLLLMDALLNFSRQYLPERRGAKTMDAPLVLTSIIDPKEVDEQVLDLDVAWRYPLEMYEMALLLKKPGEVRWGPEQKKVPQLMDRLGTPQQYEGMGFTHSTDNFNKGVLCSAYKTLPTMKEKLFGQMEIARKIRAVNLDDVARLVIQKHFLKDIKGNLKKFSMQEFRCVKCNEKFRRPPLCGKCTACGGKLVFTISEGSVIKYLGPSLELCNNYNFSPYLKQTIEMLKTNVDNVFGKDKDKQVGLGDFFT